MATDALARVDLATRAGGFGGHVRLPWRALGLGLASALVVLVTMRMVPAARDFLRGLSLVMRAADVEGIAGTAAGLPTVGVREQIITIAPGTTPLRARAFLPDRSTQTVLLVGGLQPAGIDDERFIGLARELARSGIAVVTPDIPELSNFEIGPGLTDQIERAALWLAVDSGLAPQRRIGLMGVSFSGGLCLVAAGRPALAPHLSYVVAYGGYADLPRVLEYSCADSGVSHGYSLAIAMLTVADRLVPPDQAQSLRDGTRQYLSAAYRERNDPVRAAREIAELRQRASYLPQPAGGLLTELVSGDLGHLGSTVLPIVHQKASSPALSPSHSAAPVAPVFLLHAKDDNVIPSAESTALASSLRARGVPVRLLITPLLSHADADRPIHVRDAWQLARFWGDILSR